MPTLSPRHLAAVLVANGLLRVASAAGGALIGFYLATLALQGRAVDAALLGALGVVVSVAEVAAAVPVGVLADRWSPRVLLVLGALLGAAATQVFGISEAIGLFYLARALQGVATAAGGPALLAHLTDVTSGDKAIRGRVMSFYELSLLVGLALGGLVGGRLWDGFHQLAFSLLAVIYLVAAALFAWGARGGDAGARPAAAHNPVAGLRRALTDPMLRRLAPAWLAVNAIVGLWLTHIGFQLNGPQAAGQFLVGRFTASQVGYILLGYSIVFAVGVTIWGYLLGRVARVRALRIALVAMLLVCVWLYLLNLGADWPLWVRWSLLALAALCVMVESGFTPAALAYLADVAGQGEGRGATMGVYTLLLGLGQALGAGVGGVLATLWAFNGLVVGTVGLAVVALVALVLLSEDVGAESAPGAVRHSSS
jgi:MFS family permease